MFVIHLFVITIYLFVINKIV